MDQQTTILAIIVGVILLALLVWLFMRQKRTTNLRDKYGDEYDRTLEATGNRSKAEDNLVERERRVAKFDIRPLTADERDRYTGEWREVKSLFVDSPQEAVLRGDRLLTGMMETRGYPMNDFDQRYEDLTVDHADVARHYREGHDIAHKSDATTEEMRRALNRYEKLFDEMVRDAGTADRTDHTETTSASAPANAPVSAPADAPATAVTTKRDVDGDGDPDVVTTRVTRPN